LLTRVLEHTTQPIILIQDGAKYYTSAETKAFFAQQTARLQGVQLPTYSPDYNPIEKLWKKIKQQETHLPYFPTFEALIGLPVGSPEREPQSTSLATILYGSAPSLWL
jgi:DDE superfamily endonuclease